MSRPINLVFLAGGAAAVVGVAWAAPAPSSPVSSGTLVNRTYACGERTVAASFDGERAWLTVDDRTILLRRSNEAAARYDGDDVVLLEQGAHAVLKTPGRVELCLH